MSAAPALRCMMKIRTCGLFWYKAFVTLSYPENKAHDTTSQGLLTIERPKALGGDLRIPLGRGSGKHMPTLIFASEKDQKRCRFTVCYGFWRRCVTVHAATDALYQAWWAALETAYMSFELKQISRALATNFDVLPEPEPEQESDLEEISVMNDEMNNMPLLEDLSSISAAEVDGRESWQSSESPDELVVISSMTDCTPDGSGDELSNKPAIDCTRELNAAKDKRRNKVHCEPRDVKPSALSSSDVRRIDDSLIESDVLEHLPSDVRGLMDSSSSNSSWSTGSSLDSDVVALLPSDLQEMLESCGNLSDGVPESECCDLSNESFDIVERLCHDDNNGEGSSSDKQPENGPTLPETGGGIILDGVLLTTEAIRIRTTRDVFALPFHTTQTPFERLRQRQRRRAATNNCNAVHDVTSSTPDHSARGMPPTCFNASSSPNNVDSSDLLQRPGSAEDVYGTRREPPKLVIGRIDVARVEEIAEFAVRHVPDADRSPKKPLVIERVTRAWTDVARFAFRPHAVTDHVAHKHHHQRAAGHFHDATPSSTS